jgi:hypothetical protein
MIAFQKNGSEVLEKVLSCKTGKGLLKKIYISKDTEKEFSIMVF